MSTNLPTGYSRPEQVQAARERADAIRTDIDETWQRLEEAYNAKDHVTLGYVTWATYVRSEFGMSRGQSYRLLDQAHVIRQLSEASGTDVSRARDISVRTASVLAPHLPNLVETVKERTKGKQEATREKIVAEVVEQAVAQQRPAPSHPSSPVPPAGRYVQLSFDAFWEEAEKYANGEGRTLDEMIRQAVSEYIARRKKTINASPPVATETTGCAHTKTRISPTTGLRLCEDCGDIVRR